MSGERALEELKSFHRGLVVSCQARQNNPMQGPVFMAAMAAAAVQGGAAGVRAEGVADITAIRARIGANVPIIGILKTKMADGSVFITASSVDAQQVISAGARLVAVDGTARPRPGGESLAEVVAAVHAAGGAAMADVGTVEHAAYAIECGVDAVGTTLSGYTANSVNVEGPDFLILEVLAKISSVPVFAEGRIWTREEARLALDLGASFVVVGTAITNPLAITARFTTAMSGT